jgi:ParB family chromosome partitioning protein
MNIKKRGLSRGLNALLSNKTMLEKIEQIGQNNLLDLPSNTSNLKNPVSNLAINKLVPGKFQPRHEMPPEELAELAESIKTQGILQPLIVRQLTTGNYEIIAGERRWQAATIAGLQEVPVIIKNVNDKDALTIALVENIQREDLNPVDEAIALDRLSKEFSLTHNEVALAIGKSRASVSNLLRIINLPKEIKNMLEKNQLDLGHAKVLLGAPNNLQLKIANEIIKENLSVRATEQLLVKLLKPQTNFNSTVSLDPDVKKLQKKLSDTLGARVTIINKTKGRGKLIIEYNSLEELEGILEHITTTEDL